MRALIRVHPKPFECKHGNRFNKIKFTRCVFACICCVRSVCVRCGLSIVGFYGLKVKTLAWLPLLLLFLFVDVLFLFFFFAQKYWMFRLCTQCLLYARWNSSLYRIHILFHNIFFIWLPLIDFCGTLSLTHTQADIILN